MAASRILGRLVVTFTDSHRHTPRYREVEADGFPVHHPQQSAKADFALLAESFSPTASGAYGLISERP